MNTQTEVSICEIDRQDEARQYFAIFKMSDDNVTPLFLVNDYGRAKWTKNVKRAAVWLDEELTRRHCCGRYTIKN